MKLTVQGQGKVYGNPDRATINVGVKTVKPTASMAREYHSPTVFAINKSILESGVVSSDIQSSSFAFGQAKEYNRKTQETENLGFFASNTISIRVRDLSKISDLLDALAIAGATDITNPERDG